ncbi:MAG: hypothetical protein JXQ87_17835 [Bacteroidia bacterium]
MAHKKNGQLTTSSEWAKHLRKYLKNQFWKGERKAEKQSIKNELFETDNLMWQFEELIKTLIAMSMSLNDQKNYYGFGVTADEMLEDFFTYYTLNKERFVERELINEECKTLLDDIDSLTNLWSSEKEEDFWFEMENYEDDWNTLREKAKLTLTKMNKNNLTVDINHENKFDKSGKLVVQKTKIELVEKKTTPQQQA